MQKPFVSLSKYVLPIALILPAMLFAESFKVTIDREAHIGSMTLKPGDYKVNIEGGKAEFQKGKETATTEVKQEALPTKAAHGYIRYANGPENRISEIVTRGAMVRWLFP